MTPDQLFGLTDSHLADWTDTRIGAGKSWRMHRDVLGNWQAMLDTAQRDGVCILPVSCFRDFARQQLIWDEKFAGQRPVHDDAGHSLKRADFSDDRPAGVQADTHVERLAAQTCPVVAEDAESRLTVEGGSTDG